MVLISPCVLCYLHYSYLMKYQQKSLDNNGFSSDIHPNNQTMPELLSGMVPYAKSRRSALIGLLSPRETLPIAWNAA